MRRLRLGSQGSEGASMTDLSEIVQLKAKTAARPYAWAKWQRLAELQEQRADAAEAALSISADDVGRIMHESWSRTKRAQGFHGRHEACMDCHSTAPDTYPFGAASLQRCSKFHPDLIPWEELPQGQQDLNLHAFDDVFAEIRRRAGLNKEHAGA